ncbi:uncharacterized protein At3g28850 [Brachypodium distachyon]|uniref:Glutaredoxin domain-containing protein n=1 Tax=Brachypodium distachyon TaxID=15368 RepID=I1GPY9_BRADI|nr:uncharacterized protein At3g28850 [Brachypodium distachyon]KQK13963.1 hypothetical protein BRADI_1g13610v3 [Brachypodium distachyon]|eukprot:XP_003561793.1 uncharacterized protein At3g28850 [Brachypodium distachyon]
MRGLRSRILRTLQSFPNAAAAAAVQSNILLLPPPDAFTTSSPPEKCRLQEHAPSPMAAGADQAVPELPTVSDGDDDDKENVSPEANPRKAKKMKVSSDHCDHDGSAVVDPGLAAAASAKCYRRPDLASATLFDPDLLAEFRGVVDAYARAFEKTKRSHDEEGDDDAVLLDGMDPLAGFESRCPPGGERAVVLYTTSLRGVRKTFEDCATVRRLLDGLRVAFLERDVSMHAPYRDELRALLLPPDSAAMAMPLPPRLFVDGRYVGGADEVVALHERSGLRPMLRGAPRRAAGEAACAVCGGDWFVVCGGCSGRHWLYDDGGGGGSANRVPCPGCNENGLVPCPLCS